MWQRGHQIGWQFRWVTKKSDSIVTKNCDKFGDSKNVSPTLSPDWSQNTVNHQIGHQICHKILSPNTLGVLYASYRRMIWAHITTNKRTEFSCVHLCTPPGRPQAHFLHHTLECTFGEHLPLVCIPDYYAHIQKEKTTGESALQTLKYMQKRCTNSGGIFCAKST